MQFKSFDWLSHHGIWEIIPCSTNMVSVRVFFWGVFILVFYILGAFFYCQWKFSFKQALPFSQFFFSVFGAD